MQRGITSHSVSVVTGEKKGLKSPRSTPTLSSSGVETTTTTGSKTPRSPEKIKIDTPKKGEPRSPEPKSIKVKKKD